MRSLNTGGQRTIVPVALLTALATACSQTQTNHRVDSTLELRADASGDSATKQSSGAQPSGARQREERKARTPPPIDPNARAVLHVGESVYVRRTQADHLVCWNGTPPLCHGTSTWTLLCSCAY
jgi:hypothetical protein